MVHCHMRLVQVSSLYHTEILLFIYVDKKISAKSWYHETIDLKEDIWHLRIIIITIIMIWMMIRRRRVFGGWGWLVGKTRGGLLGLAGAVGGCFCCPPGVSLNLLRSFHSGWNDQLENYDESANTKEIYC